MPVSGTGINRITAGFTAMMAVLAAVLLAGPPPRASVWTAPLWLLAGLAGAGAVLIGIRRNAPLRRLPWRLLGGALFAMSVGDTLFELGDGREPLATLSYVGYLASFPLFAGGVVQLTKASVVLRDRARLLGLLMFTAAAAMVGWLYVINPLLDADISGADRSVVAVFVVGDLLILVTMVRLVIAARRSPAVVLLTLGATGGLVSDLWYVFAGIGGWTPGNAADLGYLVLYTGWGAAALHPSMTELTAPVDPSTAGDGVDRRGADRRGVERRAAGGSPRDWMTLVGVSLVVPPGVLLVESLAGRRPDGLIFAVVSLVMFLLVFTHLTDTIGRYRQSLTRERGLREMSGALVAATEVAEVETAVRAAVGRLVPQATPHAVVVSAGDDYGTVAPRSMEADRRTRLTGMNTLHPDLAGQLGDQFAGQFAGHDTAVLVCPLVPDRFGAGTHAVGWLFVAADGRVLTAARDAVEVLAVQATLALERIQLTEAMNRRDSERYLRTVVQNTTDVVLVVDVEERIRYASPSLVRELDVHLPMSGALRDIVDPEDHPLIRQTLEWSGDPDDVLDRWRLRRTDTSRIVVEVSSRDLRKDRMVRGFVLTMREVAGRREYDPEGIRRMLQASPAGQNRRSATNKFR